MRCFYPRTIHCDSNGHSYEVPCGKCPACRKRKQQEWVFRMDMERKYGGHKNCFFCTLTYDESVLPTGTMDVDTGEYFECNTPVLRHDHLTGFWRRYRRYSGDKCRMFSVGEYGDKFDRPHYHFIIYTDLTWKKCLEEIKHSWSYSVSADTPLGYGVFERDSIYKTKRKLFGLVTLSAVSIRRMRYCAKYIVKDSNSSSIVPKFARCSRGLGKCFLTNSLEWLPCKRNLQTLVYTSDSKPCLLPRYYRKRIFSGEELELMNIQRIENEFGVFDRLSHERYVEYIQNLWCNEENQKQIVMLSRYNLTPC